MLRHASTLGFVHTYRLSARAFSTEMDLLHRSSLPTNHFQNSLPRLAVPKLDDTLDRYLSSQSVLLDADALAAHRSVVKTFQEGPGPHLQAALNQFAKQNSHTSYITDFWFDMYLRDRRPVPLTHTPFMSMKRDPQEALNRPDTRATNLIYSSVRFSRALSQGVLSPEVFHLNPAKSDTDQFRRAVSWCPNRVATYVAYLFKAYPLDMSQFGNLFSSTRIPRPEKDELKAYPDSRHVLVMRRGHLFVFDVVDDSGRALSPLQILANVRHVLGLDLKEAEFPLGALTSASRDAWMKARDHLLELGNAEALEQVDSAQFVLCLDDEDLMGQTEKKMRSFLYGLTPNRWFDKSVSLLMDATGDTAINFEHSWGDGVAVLRYFNELFADSTTKPVVQPETEVPPGISPNVRQLSFNLDAAAEAAVTKAKSDFDARTASLGIDFRQSETFGRADVKRAKLSPDSVMQLAFQLAYYLMHGHAAPTYESCSTSAFKHGRTETVRSATPETLFFCRLVTAGSSSAQDLLEVMRKCSDKHNQLTKEAAMGKGWDRHLFALRKMAEAESSSVALFEDPAYQHINHIIVSTSTLSSPAVEIGGFGAVVPDGYGVGYGIQDRGIGCIVTAYPEIGGTNLGDFMRAFERSAEALKAVMDGQVPAL